MKIKLRELKITPFVMLYNKNGERAQREFARWVNRRFYKWVPFKRFEDFLNARTKK